MISTLDRFTLGFFAPWRGLALVMAHPELRKYVVIPFVLSIIVFVFGGAWALSILWTLVPSIGLDVVAWISPTASGWALVALKTLVLLLLWPAILFALIYSLLIITKIVGVPFHTLLAEKVLATEGLLTLPSRGFLGSLRLSAHMFWVSILKLCVFAVAGVALFLCSLFPVLNLIAAFGGLLLVAFDLCDYAFEAMAMGFSERARFFRKNLMAFAGLAAALGFVFMIPGLNLLMFPAAVAGASDLTRRLQFASRFEGKFEI
jgi:CysZ protein